MRGVFSTTVHKFADAGKDLSTRSNIIVLVDEAHRTQSSKEKSLAGQMRAALPSARFFGMAGTPIRNLATDTFALFGEESDPGRVLRAVTGKVCREARGVRCGASQGGASPAYWMYSGDATTRRGAVPGVASR
ncbi:hypothetical protein [Streptomyces sp. NPDC046197]|uniref:hypothetical protein n=1 Tax=Streptomyces sp. NPDC046197 TaxID=3154337 RepID=UPI0033CBFD93